MRKINEFRDDFDAFRALIGLPEEGEQSDATVKPGEEKKEGGDGPVVLKESSEAAGRMMRRFEMRLPNDIYLMLTLMSKLENKSMSEIVVESIERWIRSCVEKGSYTEDQIEQLKKISRITVIPVHP